MGKESAQKMESAVPEEQDQESREKRRRWQEYAHMKTRIRELVAALARSKCSVSGSHAVDDDDGFHAPSAWSIVVLHLTSVSFPP